MAHNGEFGISMTSSDLEYGQSKKFKIMTHLLYMEHLHTKIEMDPMSIKQKSGGDTTQWPIMVNSVFR